MSKRGTTFIQLDVCEAMAARGALVRYVKEIDRFGHSQEYADLRSDAVALHNRINKRFRKSHPKLAADDLGDPA